MKSKTVLLLFIAVILLVGAVSAAAPLMTVSGYSNGKPFITKIYSNPIPNPTGFCKVNYITGVTVEQPTNAQIGDNTHTNVPVVTTYFLPYRTV